MHHFLLPILLLVSLYLTSSQSPINPSTSPSPNLTLDFGRIIFHSPNAVMKPKTLADISNLINSISSSPTNNNMTIAPRGVSHSTYGQAQAPGGIVVDMRSLPNSIRVVKVSDGNDYVDAGGGALWVDVLRETLKQGLTPRSWTDYLYLTVGGTLSVAGISGQAFKHGPQISNVLELDVITGKGELLTCSSEQNPDLFYAVLGGLGQFGIITRARIILKHAPHLARQVSIPYDDFNRFTKDEELLISMGEVDYLEGFLKFKNGLSGNSLNSKSSHLSVDPPSESGGLNVYYSIEFAIYHDETKVARNIVDRILSQLRVNGSTVDIVDLSYFDFLNRVEAEEDELRRKGLWEVAHPWLILFVPRVHIGRFHGFLLETLVSNNNGSSGPIIIYPTHMDKWNPKMSAVLPQDDAGDGIVYPVSLLTAAPPSCTSGTPCLDALLRCNQKIINTATATMGAKQYLPFYQNEEEWKAHFGEGWVKFKEIKSRFDPLNILTPGQRIFKRKGI